MKINNLKINGFGKLKNKEVKLSDGINIIYGENEAGKSSMLKFISSMLYGASKNKNGKELSDFDRYKPWQTEEFSGKIEYSLDNGEQFEVYREFKKKNPVIYNSKMEDISKTFVIDKTKGIDFFTEQTGIDEETFNIVQDMYSKNKNRAQNSKEYLLRGFLVCKECGHTISVGQAKWTCNGEKRTKNFGHYM